MVGGFATQTGGRNSSSLPNSFHEFVKRSHERMAGNGRPVAAVYAAPRRLMKSEYCQYSPNITSSWGHGQSA